MEDTQIDVQPVLHAVTLIREKYRQISIATGEDFNLFKILKVETDEVRHSKMIAELLNPRGLHQCGEAFLALFVDCLNNQIAELNLKLNYSDTKVIAEKSIGFINQESEEGGRIDIVIKDIDMILVIENKIFASDQPKQLRRYKNMFPTGILLYLTLDGKIPTKESAMDLVIYKDYHCISYKGLITDWITKCREIAIAKPYIRESLSQYLDTIKSLNNQSKNNQMSEEISLAIFKDENSFESARLVAGEFEKAKIRLLDDFWMEFRESIVAKYPNSNPTFNRGKNFSTANLSALIIGTGNINIHHIGIEPLNGQHPIPDFSNLYVGYLVGKENDNSGPFPNWSNVTITNLNFSAPETLIKIAKGGEHSQQIKSVIMSLIDKLMTQISTI